MKVTRTRAIMVEAGNSGQIQDIFEIRVKSHFAAV